MESLDAGRDSGREANDARGRRCAGWWLLLAALLGSLATFPYTLSVLKQAGWIGEQARDPVSILCEHLATDIFLALGAVAFGIRLGKPVGLGSPLLVGWPPVDESSKRRVRNTLVLAAALGVGIGVLDAIAERAASPWLPSPRFAITAPPAWSGLLASVGAGVTEEIVFRLGLMTFLVWMGARDVKRFPPPAWVVWASNLLAALLFGAAHLPQAALFYGFSAPIAAYTLLLNAIPGVIFGWLYWRRGLVASMVAHGVADVVLKAVLPLLGLT